jgi:rhodanese-related sulfurtransferase
MDEINHDNYEDLPDDKYIICIDSIGLRARRAAQILYNEGYLTLYVEGGYDMLIPLLENKNI